MHILVLSPADVVMNIAYTYNTFYADIYRSPVQYVSTRIL